MKSEKTKTIIHDLTKDVGPSGKFKIWMAFLLICFVICSFSYLKQLQEGLGVTGMRDNVSWGIYVSGFIFFVATSLIGLLINSILKLLGQSWITPISRIAEIITIAFAIVAGVIIIVDMGRPEKLFSILIYGRLQSPVVWDLVLLIFYIIISLLIYFVTLIPDLSILKQKTDQPLWHRKIYSVLSLNWQDTPENQKIINRIVRTLALIAIPAGLAIHTITSWLFAFTPRTGWKSTIFGPYFVAGAFVSGVAALIVLCFILRKTHKLDNYITDFHFRKLANLLVIVSLVYLYFNINEYLVPAYTMQTGESSLLQMLFSGRYALLFWTVQISGVLIPAILPMFNVFKKTRLLFIIAVIVLIASWFKRYLIVIPVMENSLLPVQNVPLNFEFYKATTTEIIVSAGTIVLLVIIISILSKIFPVVPVSKTVEAQNENV